MPYREMSLQEINDLLSGEKAGRLATMGPSGPYITPMCFVWHDHALYFHSKRKGAKIDNILANPAACFEVSRDHNWLPSAKPCDYSVRYHSVQVFGPAKIVADGEEKVKALNLISAKYLAGSEFEAVTPHGAAAVAVIKLTAEKISGRKNID